MNKKKEYLGTGTNIKKNNKKIKINGTQIEQSFPRKWTELLILKSQVDGWSKSRFKDCLQQSKLCYANIVSCLFHNKGIS